MKRIFILITLFLFSCETKNKSSLEKNVESQIAKPKGEKLKVTENSIIQKNQNDWQQGFGLTHNIDKDSIWKKPVRYYIENKDCFQTAIDFYFGKFRPVDDEKTEKLLGLVTTDNSELRPFYRWILNKTILIQDGALAEYTGIPARKYAERFPNEFFEYMDIEKSNEKYLNWCNSIMYSGFYDKDSFENPELIRKEFAKTMSKNCKNCDQTTLERINKFTDDCFPDSQKDER